MPVTEMSPFGGHPAHARRTPTLVGREAELALFVDAVVSPGRLVIVEGEAGIGKSRLIAEALRVTPDVPALIGRCQPVRNPFPLGPVIDALRTVPALDAEGLSPVVGALRPLLPELSHMLPPTPEPLSEPGAKRHRLFRAIFELLRSAPRCTLVIEDLHWADEVTIEFLHMAAALQPAGNTLVVTVRSEDEARPAALTAYLARARAAAHAVWITLRPLDQDHVSTMIATLLDTAEVSEGFAEYLHAKTSGIPFAIEEMLRYLVERGAIVRHDDGGWTRGAIDDLGLPPALRDAILARIANLSADARAVLQSCAVLGPASEATLARATGRARTTITRTLSEAIEASVLVWDGAGYGFRHALLRDAVYESIPHPRRVGLHRRAAASLEVGHPRPLDALVHHYRAAGDVKRYVDAATDAALAARVLGDCNGAVSLLREAIAMGIRDPARRLRTITRLADFALDGRIHEEPLKLLGRIADDPTETRQIRGASRIFRGWLLCQVGEELRGRDELKLGVADATRNVHYPLALATLGVPRWDDTSLEEHDRFMNRAVRAAHRRPSGSIPLSVTLDHISMMLTMGNPGAWDLIDALPIATDEAGTRHSIVRGLMNLIPDLHALGYTMRAEEFMTLCESWMASEPHVFVRFQTMVAIERAMLDLTTGRWDGLAERARRLVDEAAALPWIRTTAELVHLTLASASEPASVAERAAYVLDAAHRRGYLFAAFSVAAFVATVHLDDGRPEEALKVCEAERAMMRRKQAWPIGSSVIPPLVRALVGTGEFAVAAAAVDELADSIEGLDGPAARAHLTLARAVLLEAERRHDEAARMYRDAADALGALPRAHESLRARLDAGRCSIAAGDGADDVLAALAGSEDLGAKQEARRARALLRRAGIVVQPSWRGGRRGYGLELSPREHEVAALVAEGLTNKEIAQRLFVSEKTVEHHVSAALRKLAVASRRALARALP